jgi:hypothetical protein
MPDPLDAEDAKLVTLARASRARAGSAQGAAVRDETGRTYTAADVVLPSLRLSALQAAVAAAASSGARSLEAAAVVVGADRHPGDLDDGVAAVRDLGGPGLAVHVADPEGTVGVTLRS